MNKVVKTGAIVFALIFVPGTIPLAIGTLIYKRLKKDKLK